MEIETKKLIEEGTKKIVRPKFNYADTHKFYSDVITSWEPAREVWPFRYGEDILCGGAALTSLYITYFFRRQLKLAHVSKLTCYTPVVGFATISCFVSQNAVINSHLFSDERCSLCSLTKSAYLQLGFGIVYPLFMAPLVSFYIADKLLTYPIPSLALAPKEVFQVWRKFVLKIARPIFISAAAQVFLATLVTQQKIVFINRHF